MLTVVVHAQFIIFKGKTNENTVDHLCGCRFDQFLSIISLKNAENTRKKKEVKGEISLGFASFLVKTVRKLLTARQFCLFKK